MYFASGMAQPSRAVRTALIALLRSPWLPLLVAGCMSSDDDIDLATYVEQTEPADVLYNQGLANLERRPPQGGQPQVRRRRPPAPLFGVRPQIDGDGRLRQLPPGQLRRGDQRRPSAMCTLYPSIRRRGLCAVHRRPQLFPADPRRDAGPEGIAPRHRGDGRGGPALARIPNMSRTPGPRSASPATSSPARKCRSAATISSGANISPRSSASATSSRTIPTPAMSRRRWRA